MNIIHLEDYFHPDAGYQVNILAKYMVKQGHKVTIVTAELDKIPESLTSFFGKENIQQRDELYTKNTGVIIIRLPINGFISGRAIFTKELDKTIKHLNPDILYVHGNDTLTGIRYISKLGKLDFPLISDSHMLQMASQNPFNKVFKLFYKIFITPKIIKNQLTIIRTQDDDYVKKYLGIPLSQCPWISVGSDTLLFHPDKTVKESFRRIYKIDPNDFVVVYAGKLDESKGGLLLAETFLKKIEGKKKLVLLVVGNSDGKYGKQVEQLFAKSENRIIRFPTQKYIDLAKFYQSADLALFPRQCSLSFYDAQACGLPVISENNNINTERMQMNNGFTFKSGDSDDFKDKILRMINTEEKEYKQMRENALKFVQKNYNYEMIAQRYTDTLINERNRFKKNKL